VKPPLGKTKHFYEGWQARLDGKKMKKATKFKQAARRNELEAKLYYSYGMSRAESKEFDKLEAAYWKHIERGLEWDSGYRCCARALGRIRKQERLKEEIKQQNHEHDMLVELGREYGT
jgi:hypothetical protein